MGKKTVFEGLKINDTGYVLLYHPEHHPKKNGQYVREHFLVVEFYMKRYLGLGEEVHHINKNRMDNRVENLMVFNNHGAHWSFDRLGHCDPMYVVFDGRTIARPQI